VTGQRHLLPQQPPNVCQEETQQDGGKGLGTQPADRHTTWLSASKAKPPTSGLLLSQRKKKTKKHHELQYLQIDKLHQDAQVIENSKILYIDANN